MTGDAHDALMELRARGHFLAQKVDALAAEMKPAGLDPDRLYEIVAELVTLQLSAGGKQLIYAATVLELARDAILKLAAPDDPNVAELVEAITRSAEALRKNANLGAE